MPHWIIFGIGTWERIPVEIRDKYEMFEPGPPDFYLVAQVRAMSVLALPGRGDDPVVPFVLASFAALIYYNAAELLILCLATFKRRGSLYFWCLLSTSISLIPHGSGFILLFFRPDVSHYVAVCLIIVGWCGTVTGHSLVLWSRLHLVLQNPRLLRTLLVVILTNAVLLHVPTSVLLFGSVSDDPNVFAAGYNIMERIQLVGFCIQETILSGIYVWEVAKMLRLRSERRNRRILTQLLAMNIVVLVIDFVVVIIEYAGFYAVQVMFKPVAYSIKLKLEYAVLQRLVKIAKGGSATESAYGHGFDSVPSTEELDRSQTRSRRSCMLEMHEGDARGSNPP
ncbi:hypothetical protein BJY01DRAFT_227330 [Aspergillus pseudoustus]|uniref:DUF7703 domain-containing protein n=1 Tax=Aspergillus pseudoustus TaxID=1810923 RepID=A0ABR4IS03_9EURO